MEKKISQFRQSNLPAPYKSKAMLFRFILALLGIFLVAYFHKDSILQILLLTSVGIIVPLLTLRMKWRMQIIEMGLKEGRRLSFNDMRATKAGQKSLNYLLLFFGLYLILLVLGFIFPERLSSFACREFYLKMLREIGNIGTPYVTPPSPSPLHYKLTTCTDTIFGTIYYLFGGAIGSYIPLYLWARKLPR
jgi:hypothetical protein